MWEKFWDLLHKIWDNKKKVLMVICVLIAINLGVNYWYNQYGARVFGTQFDEEYLRNIDTTAITEYVVSQGNKYYDEESGCYNLLSFANAEISYINIYVTVSPEAVYPLETQIHQEWGMLGDYGTITEIYKDNVKIFILDTSEEPRTTFAQYMLEEMLFDIGA